jgi:hypothetical protein
VSTLRASLSRLLDATHALLAALVCDDLAGAERWLRERDAALALLARECARAPLSEAEREALARAARAGAEASRRCDARLAALAGELGALRGARAALPRAAGQGSRSLARA